VRLASAAAWLALAALLGGCGLARSLPRPSLPSFQSEEEDPPRGGPGTNGRALDIYAQSPAREGPIEDEDAAIASVLGNPALLPHLRQIEADYAGRRIAPLKWLVRARPERAIPKGAKLADPEREAVTAALASDGSVWWVEIATNVRESKNYYVCEVTLARGGDELTPFDEPPRRCRWQRADQAPRPSGPSY